MVSPKSKNLLQVRTPEGVVFHVHLASPMLRFLAWLLDLMVIMLILNITSIIVQFFSIISVNFAAAFNAILYFVLTIGYAVFFEWWWQGQTLGKRVLKIRVVDELGMKLRFSQVLMRNLLRAIDSFPLLYLVGGISMMVSKRFQRLGDFTAGTVVARLIRHEEPDLQQIMHGKYNTLRDYPHLIARFRQNTTPEVIGVALEALLRRKDLDNKPRLQIFSNLAAHFKSLVKLPENLLDGLSDEQLVANVIEVLYQADRDQKPSIGEKFAPKIADAVPTKIPIIDTKKAPEPEASSTSGEIGTKASELSETLANSSEPAPPKRVRMPPSDTDQR